MCDIAWKALRGAQAFRSSVATFSTGDLNQQENKVRSVHRRITKHFAEVQNIKESIKIWQLC